MSRQQRPFGQHIHTFNYFVISCPILRSFSFLSFGNKFRLKITSTLLSKGACDHLKDFAEILGHIMRKHALIMRKFK